MHGVRRCRRSTLLAAAAVLALLAGCSAGSASSSGRTSSPASSSPSRTPSPPVLPRDVDPRVVGRAHAASADLPELADRPYALGRVLHNAGMAVSLPRGVRYVDPVLAGPGLLASASVPSGPHCQTYYLSPTGRLLELRGACNASVVNASHAFVAGRYVGLGESPERFALYALPSGRLAALSPVLPGTGGYQVMTFDGGDVILDREIGATHVRWNPVTGAVAQEPRPQHTLSAQQAKLSENEWASVPSPDGTLSALYSSGGALVGIWRTDDEKFVLRPRDVPATGQIDNAFWADDHTVRFIVWTQGSSSDFRLATLDLSTRQITRSRTVHGDLRIAWSPGDRG
jgi:hypothetical protein